jgi:CRP-like cAMP-binding protein
MSELIGYIEKFGSITIQEKQLILALFQKIQIGRGDYFVEAGKISGKIAFVESGIFRSVYYDKTGNDFTRYFIYEGRFIGDLHNFVIQSASSDYIEAITDCSVWYVDHQSFDVLQKEISIWPLMMTKLYAFVTESKLKTANTMMHLEAKERYRLFLNHYPGLANRVPLSMLASYLGITSSSLSRIRRNI